MNYSEGETWAELSLRQRCKRVAEVASVIAQQGDQWARSCQSPWRVDPLETISGELLPLCAALKYIGREGNRVLKTRRLGWRGRPVWLWGIRSRVRRDPHGTVLVLGTWNYPLLLSGAQIGQALAAGNEVLFKPAEGCERVSERLVEAFHCCGIPKSSLRLLDSSKESAINAIDAGVDLIVLTGAASTGRAVLRRSAETLTPCILELSGCDAVVVLPGADLDRAAKAIAFGLTFNSGATCIGPRRLLAAPAEAEAIVSRLSRLLSDQPAMVIHPAARPGVVSLLRQSIEGGAVDCLGKFDPQRLENEGVMQPLILRGVKPQDAIAGADLFAPVLSVLPLEDGSEAAAIVNACPYRLAASVFGPRADAERLAQRLRVGSVAINDLIVPTADPRVPFGGRGQSGFGVTRGPEGLLAMTVPVVVGSRHGGLMPHVMPRRPSDAQTLLGALQLTHGRSLVHRWAGLKQILTAPWAAGADDLPVDDSR